MPQNLHSPKQRAAFRRQLERWYAAHRRPFPWRETKDPYAIWVSEVLLQQTQTSRIDERYRSFLRRFPTLQALAAADLEEVLKAWEGLGYYARARNLHRAAERIVKEHGGTMPADHLSLRALPGVGDYTAAAVLSIAFDHPLAAVDGNVKRVLGRLFCLAVPPGDPRNTAIFHERATALLDRRRPGTFNQALMELGATVCRPRAPRCVECPVTGHCAAFQSGRQSEFPVPRPSSRTPERHVAIGVIWRRGRILITRRPLKGLLGGLWEFPGGQIEAGEEARAACRREIAEETGLAVSVDEHVGRVRHAYSHFRLVLEVFRCRALAGRVTRHGPIDHRWVRPAELAAFPLPAATQKAIALLGLLV